MMFDGVMATYTVL